MVRGWAAVAAQQLAAIPALYAVADVAVCVGAVHQGAELLEGHVVRYQVRELRRAPHLQHSSRNSNARQSSSIGSARNACGAQTW